MYLFKGNLLKVTAMQNINSAMAKLQFKDSSVHTVGIYMKYLPLDIFQSIN